MNVPIESAVITWEPGWPEGLPDGRHSAAWLLGCPQNLTGLGGTLGLHWSTSSRWRRTSAPQVLTLCPSVLMAGFLLRFAAALGWGWEGLPLRLLPVQTS